MQKIFAVTAVVSLTGLIASMQLFPATIAAPYALPVGTAFADS